MKQAIAIIMGAKVQPDGSPSRAMTRRVEGALSLRTEFDEIVFIPTGAKGESGGRSEATVMSDLLKEAAIPPDRIIPDPEAKDTLQSVLNCARIIRTRRLKGVVVICSDRYHIFRSGLLLRMLGIPSVRLPMPSGFLANGWPKWTYFYLREVAATVVDVVLLTAVKIRGAT